MSFSPSIRSLALCLESRTPPFRVKGTRYFNCPPLHGGIVRPDKVKVGDYPERDPFEEDEI